MKRLIVICEGRSEVNFISKLLYKSFITIGISLEARTIPTGKNKCGGFAKGGSLNFDRVKPFLINTLNESASDSNCFVTTFFDYYALNSKFPNYEETQSNSSVYEKVKMMEEGLKNSVIESKGNFISKFIPYIQLHEFESLLFCDIEKVFENEEYISENTVSDLNKIIEKFEGNPELINNSTDTALSKRILKIIPSYQKTIHGYKGLEKIGLLELENKCIHFKEWLDKIRDIAKT